MNWQTEYMAFDSNTGFTLRVHQTGYKEDDPWTWHAYDPDMDEISDDFIENYAPQEHATKEEACIAALAWYESYERDTADFENDNF